MISGSYPGEIYLFAGNAAGEFEKPVALTDKDGEVLNWERATAVFVVDWDEDGDLDIVSGDIQGRVSLVENEAGGPGMKFAKPVPLSAGGREIRTSGRNSGPVVEDWDGDGRKDLIIGCGDGSVIFCRNTSESGAPVLAAPETLIGRRGEGIGDGGAGNGGAGNGGGNPCGMRAKLAVTDWNGDGKLDLLVGDFSSEQKAAPKLTAEQAARRDELQARQRRIGEATGKMYQRLYPRIAKELLAEMGVEVKADLAEITRAVQTLDDEKRMKYLQAYQKKIREHPAYGKLMAASTALWEELRKYMPAYEQHGYVWLFLREG